MNILFLGNFESEHSSENYYRKTLTEMGHVIIAAQEGKTSAEDLMDAIDASNKIPVKALKIDLFFWVHTHGWQTPGIEIFMHRLRQVGIPSMAYHLDLYIGIARERQLQSDSFFQVDHFFTVDALMADWFNENHNIDKAKGHFLPAGVYKGECFLGKADNTKYPHEIIFTGSKGYHPEWPYRPQLIDWLQKTYGDRFGHYGGGGLPSVRGPELNNLYASAKLVIGDTLCRNFNYPWYSSDRLFEVTGRGGCMIYPSITGIETFFDPGDEILLYPFKDFGFLKEMIDFYLENDVQRERIRLAGFERAKSQHTYTHRFNTIFETLANEKP